MPVESSEARQRSDPDLTVYENSLRKRNCSRTLVLTVITPSAVVNSRPLFAILPVWISFLLFTIWSPNSTSQPIELKSIIEHLKFQKWQTYFFGSGARCAIVIIVMCTIMYILIEFHEFCENIFFLQTSDRSYLPFLTLQSVGQCPHNPSQRLLFDFPLQFSIFDPSSRWSASSATPSRSTWSWTRASSENWSSSFQISINALFCL